MAKITLRLDPVEAKAVLTWLRDSSEASYVDPAMRKIRILYTRGEQHWAIRIISNENPGACPWDESDKTISKYI